MNVLAPPRRFDPNYPELMDRPGLDRALLREEMQTLENFNLRLGGHQLVLDYVKRLVDSTGMASLSILDLATGAADIPRALVAWARQRRLPVMVTAVDGNPEVLQFAGELCRDWPEIQLAQHDLRALPYPADGFDLVLCSQALHHFGSADAVSILRRIHALARGGYIVNDLRRNWLTIWSMSLLTRLLARSQIFRNDAWQSCWAAFTIRELQEMAEQAGLNNFQVSRHRGFFHMVLDGKK